MAENKVRFIQMQIEEKIKLHRREISDVNRELKELKFTPQSYFKAVKDKLEANMKTATGVDVDEELDEEEQEGEGQPKKSSVKKYANETDDDEC